MPRVRKSKLVEVQKEPEVTKDFIRVCCERYYELKKQKDVLEKEGAKLKSQIEKWIDNNEEVDTRGHRWFCFGDGYIQRQVRVSKPTLDEDTAEEILGKKGLLDLVRKPIVEYEYDGDKIAQLVEDGTLTTEEFNQIFPAGNVTYATCIVTKEKFSNYQKDLKETKEGEQDGDKD